MRANYLQFFLISIFFLFTYSVTFAQTTNISGIVNSYSTVSAIGSSGCSDSITVNSVSGFGTGDSVMLIQIQGADIDSTNTSSFGIILNYANCGNYEFLKISSINGLIIHFTTSLKKSYDVNGTVQLVSIPNYTNALVTGVLTAQPWNGTTGGILAFTVSGTLTLNADIDVSGLGFRKGSASPNYYSAYYSAYCFGVSPGRGGKKGEGIAFYFSNEEYGRGAQANGGGGGNDINTAGGGGGNYGEGGHGGYAYAFAPDTLWGLRGKSLAAGISLNKAFFGGGGGGGHQNNSAGTAGSDGGGIIFIRANSITGNNHAINANGLNVTGVAGIDGAGGGGAGGSILLDVASFNTNLSIEVKGGNGGDQNYPPQCHGNGGGGGGGVILYTGTVFPGNVTTSVSGGAKGVGQCNNTPGDGLNGQAGAIVNWVIPVTVLIANAGPDKTICQGDSVQIGTPPLTGLTYTWNNGAGNTANPYVSPSTSTTYILSVSDGTCNFAYDTVTVNINPKPNATFTYTAGCGLTVNFTNASTAIQSSLWYFGDGDSSAQTSPVHTYLATGNFTVTLIVTNSFGCKDTIIQQINIVSTGIAGSQFTYQIQNCTGTVVFTNQSVNSTGYNWNFGDGSLNSTLTNPTHTYLTSGTFTVTLIASNSCSSDTLQHQVTVNIPQAVIAAFTINTQPCDLTVNFANQSQNATTWQWDFGDATTSSFQNPTHTYMAPGIYNITLIVNNSCSSDTLHQQVDLSHAAAPQSDFEFSTQPCNLTLSLTNQSQYADSLLWDFGDGTTDTTFAPIHFYLNNGIYIISLITYNQCGTDTLIKTVADTFSQGISLFDIEQQPCRSEVQFMNQSQNAFSYFWNFGDGNSDTTINPIHEYLVAGNYTITLIINEGIFCSDTIIKTEAINNSDTSNLFVPNCFTPNGDSKNEVLEITGFNDCEVYHLSIYNRWGQSVYETDDISKFWNGKFKGKDVPEGVYYFIVNGKQFSKNGTITVIR